GEKRRDRSLRSGRDLQTATATSRCFGAEAASDQSGARLLAGSRGSQRIGDLDRGGYHHQLAIITNGHWRTYRTRDAEYARIDRPWDQRAVWYPGSRHWRSRTGAVAYEGFGRDAVDRGRDTDGCRDRSVRVRACLCVPACRGTRSGGTRTGP